MKYATPESHGISTEAIRNYVDHLNSSGLSTHDVIIARGDDIVFEKYWAPFTQDFLHRMYSVTKSFVAIALGFLADEGRVNLDDHISVYFPAETEQNPDENVRKQTIRHMMMMRSAYPDGAHNWFAQRTSDRVLEYFRDMKGAKYPSGTLFRYDSTGSFVLGALVERVTGKTLIGYLEEKLFSKLGIEGAYMLKCPGGHSWSDSALLMRPVDLLKVGRFMLCGGAWNGEQLLSRDFVEEATANLVSTASYGWGNFAELGYGYLIWRTKNNSFFFNGMGCQFVVCCPDKDMILVYNGDNQGNELAKTMIIDGFFDIVYNNASDEPLPEYKGDPIPDQKLFFLEGNYASTLIDKINGRKYKLESNPMKISEFTLDFESDGGSFTYVNATGEKTINFGFGRNVFEKFPEDGYSDEVGSVRAPGNKYDAASSAVFPAKNELLIRTQIIDKYFGNLGILFSFRDDTVVLEMRKSAEDFLGEYQGIAMGISV